MRHKSATAGSKPHKMTLLSHALCVAGALLLAGCGGGNSPPGPAPVNPPFHGAISPQAPWTITQSSSPRALSNGSFAFQGCANAQTCWDSYVEVPLPVSILGNSIYSLTYTITGDATWVNDSSGNTCGGPPSLTLLLHRQGDLMALVPGFRYFSLMNLMVPLAVGTTTITNAVGDPSKWVSADGSNGSANPQLYIDAITHLASVGFGLGGGCFAAHGVAVNNGSATFQINAGGFQ